MKYLVNEKFFDSWNPDMAYILGYFYADGSLEDASYLRGKYIRVTSIDRSTIENIKLKLGSQHTIVEYDGYKNRKPRYLLRIGSIILYNNLIKLGLYPNKSLTITVPKIPKKYTKHFIRGYFDGDGCVYFEHGKGKNNKTIIKGLRTIFTSGSKNFLSQLSKLLSENKICSVGRKVYSSHRSFQLRYSTKDSLGLFLFLYEGNRDSLFLQRKYNTFHKYLSESPKRIDKSIRSVLESYKK